MTKAYVAARRKKAAKKAIEKRWRQDDINERIDRPGKYEGIYKKPKLIVRRVGVK
jgi:hypothetical protein